MKAGLNHLGKPQRRMFYSARKTAHTWNVFGVCNWSLEFIYILAGHPGREHDSTVFKHALSRYGFRVPANSFYLSDSAYALSQMALKGYSGVRYHVSFFIGNPPQNRRELFNMYHCSARNYIERLWGVLKKRFPILNDLPTFPLDKQIQIIYACATLHNFIKQTPQNRDEQEDEYLAEVKQAEAADLHIAFDNEGQRFAHERFHYVADPNEEEELDELEEEDNQDSILWRDRIAAAMWNEYVIRRWERRGGPQDEEVL